ncbi:hypothetical protein NTGBS_990007 [Candidatus Nitrotoga sp. BS]|nr:hypothetical protein NTGBS_990007 [Candidatus Nitrotoga sp. BS]
MISLDPKKFQFTTIGESATCAIIIVSDSYKIEAQCEYEFMNAGLLPLSFALSLMHD